MNKARPSGGPLFVWSGKPSALGIDDPSAVDRLRDEPLLPQYPSHCINLACLKRQRAAQRAALPVVWSGKPGSNWRPQPWQGCALPTELFPHVGTFSAGTNRRKVALNLALHAPLYPAEGRDSSHLRTPVKVKLGPFRSGSSLITGNKGPSRLEIDDHGPDRHDGRQHQ